MNLDDLIERAGEERFERACRLAWEGPRDSDELAEVQHDLAGAVFEDRSGRLDLRHVDEALLLQRLVVAEALYRRMPGYANFIPATSYLLGRHDVACVAAAFRALLEEEAWQLVDSVVVRLQVDAFEVYPEPWWYAMLAAPGDPERYRRRAERVAQVSWEVPWSAKLPVLSSLVGDPALHVAIYSCISASARSKAYVVTPGRKIDRRQALDLLRVLELPEETTGREELAEALERGYRISPVTGERMPID
jgi:hypothetical protein